ncbi:MAG TPA: glutamate-cysteine ligase family protein [Kofleriaceae bacterium]|nr:glutamate-cysteine ligase family protein [Kofleriaceae bacterium]
MTTTRQHKDIDGRLEGERQREFMSALLDDVRAVERMIAEGRFETGVRRIGAEQEMFLIDEEWRPARGVLALLDKLGHDPHFTTELGMFQLEANCAPQTLSADGLSKMHAQLDDLVDRARRAAGEIGMGVVLAGILPTMRKADLGLDNMVPSARYVQLNKIIAALKHGKFEVSIKGLDELAIDHDSVMLEACNSSFQVHLQVAPDEFARMYNLAQILAAPLMAISSNSPLLFGRRLWAETRIALFRQAVDDRTRLFHRETEARVSFGTRWVRKSVVEIYKEDIARFRALVGTDLDESPMAVLDRGETPQLRALRLHNGTIYRWNRACYGITDGKPHLRIENRIMPAGPSTIDEIANAAFWSGLMVEIGAREDDLSHRMDFDQAGANFYTAAREGIGSTFTWLDGEDIGARALILERLLPLAQAGLRRQHVDDADVTKYLGVIEERVRTARTGARWALASWNSLRDRSTPGERANAIVAATVQRQLSGRPVSEWERARLDEAKVSSRNYLRVENYMTTDLFTVHEEDAVEIVANLMIWERIRHVPVEDHEHKLVGVITHRAVLRFVMGGGSTRRTPVSEVMKRDVATVTPETPTIEALRLMRRLKVGCLPVVHNDKLVGIVTEEDFMDIASKLLEEQLGTAEQLSLPLASTQLDSGPIVAPITAEAAPAKPEPAKADVAPVLAAPAPAEP